MVFPLLVCVSNPFNGGLLLLLCFTRGKMHPLVDAPPCFVDDSQHLCSADQFMVEERAGRADGLRECRTRTNQSDGDA